MTLVKDSGNCCCYCGKEFNHHIRCTADHIIPVSKGGASNEYNKRNCCRHCNTQKKDLLPHDYLHYLLENERSGSGASKRNFEIKLRNVKEIVEYVNNAGEKMFASKQKFDWFKRRYLACRKRQLAIGNKQ